MVLTTDPPARLLYVQIMPGNFYIFRQDSQSLTVQHYVPVRTIFRQIDSHRTYRRASALIGFIRHFDEVEQYPFLYWRSRSVDSIIEYSV